MFVRSRNAMEICMFGILSVSTAGAALAGTLPPSLASAAQFGHFAAVCLWIGSIGSFVGILLPKRDRGLLLEQIALIPAAFGAFFWGAAVYFGAWKAIPIAHPWWMKSYLALASSQIALGLSVGLGVSCVVRWIQIQRYIKLREQLPDPGGQPDGLASG